MIKKIILFSAMLFAAAFSAQKKEILQKQNAELKQQIAQINAQLAKTKDESRLSVAYLEAVNKKIALREKLYNNTQKEKNFIEDDIYLRQLEINRQNKELEVLRKNYAKVLVNAYKNKGVQNKVTFILSSKSLGEAIRRIQYLKMYSEYQEKKAAEITNTAQKIKYNIAEKKKSVQQKDQLLVNQKNEIATISTEKQQKENLVKEFQANEAKLTAELRQKQVQQKALESQIRAAIAEEIRIAKANEEARRKVEAEKLRQAKIAAEKEKARIDAENRARALALEKERKAAEDAARKAQEIAAKKAADEKKRADEAAKAEASARDIARKEAAAKETEIANANARAAADKLASARAAEATLAKKNDDAKKVAETKVMTNYGISNAPGNSFASSRGNIMMPVNGTITHHFGRQPHPVFKNIMEENNGIKIAVSPGTKARCVYAGTVSRVMSSGDGTKTVLIKHGDYFTLYSNLSSVSVSQGQQLTAGVPVGTVGEDFDGSTTLDFQIWSGSNPVDPLGWVSK